MTETSTPNSPLQPPVRRWARPAKIVALVLISALAGAAVSRAAHHWHAYRMHAFMSGPVDSSAIDRRVDWMTNRIASNVKATGEQREKLATIAKAAAKDILPMRETMRDARKRAQELLSQPTLDRAAIEKLRADQIGNVDAASKRLSEAVTEAAEVLTPEQRKTLADRFPAGGSWHGGSDRD